MPERGVLITRPEPFASATACRVGELGFNPIVAPLLRVRARTPRLPDPARLQAALVSSGHALPDLAARYRQVPLFAVGDATAKRAAELGFVAPRSAGGDANALGALVMRTLRPETGDVLVAAGAHRGEALVGRLRAAGFRVIRRVLYEAIPVGRLPAAAAAALAEEEIVAALFFSAETAKAFARLTLRAGLAERLAPAEALTIGQRAAEPLKALPFRAVRVALTPTQEALLAMLK